MSAEERIRLLEAENDILNERSEDVLLLGLVAETITPLRDVDAIVRTLLERVAILYEIPYCGFARVDGASTVFRQEFVTHVDKAEGSSLRLTPEAMETLAEGAVVCSAAEAPDVGVDLELRDVEANQILLIPCSRRSRLSGVFVFAHDALDSTILVRKLIVLQQVTGLAAERMDNILLLDELKLLNVDLETRVNERTVELHRAARALEIEIAERRRAEEIIAGERHRLTSVVEHLPEGVIVLDAERKVVLANHATAIAEPLIGPVETGDELRAIGGRPLADFVSDASEPRWLEVSSESAPSAIFEVAVRSLSSHHQGSVVVLRDISEQRKVADQLLRQERIAAMGHLAAGIAHDFNNLIQAITILAEGLLLDESDDHTRRKHKTREILAVGDRAATLIRQILDYSRQAATQPQLIDLHSFVVETLTMLDRLIPETVSIEIDAVPGQQTIRFDPVQLQQVLTNLTVNSIQAMPNGGEIRVRLWNPSATQIGPGLIPESKEEDWVCLSLTDTGGGIPPEARPRIFEPFFTTKERGQGTGLGLAQSYGIIQQNHGRITFETEVDQGTTFTLYLPVEEEQTARFESKPEPSRAPLGNRETILVVEDDPAVRELTGELIEALGYRPVIARNGIKALEALAKADREIHLVLSDVAMPTMGGVELAVELERRSPSIPVVLMSGYAPDPMGGGFSSPNLAAWLQKPFSVDALASTLSEILSKSS
jgi:signal transduction histidine kinase/CheY-like chemotaxis protein